jgi:uncharacterized membrane protein
MAEATKKPAKRFNPFGWFSASFAAGVAVILPFAITVGILWAIVNLIEKAIVPMVLPLVPETSRGLIQALPGFGAIFAVVALTVGGALSANFVGRFLVKATEKLFEAAPFVSSIYGSVKQIFDTMTNPSGQSFKEAVMIEYPSAGLWSVGFVTSDTAGEAAKAVGDAVVAVFVPATPLPTAGALVYTTRNKLKPLPGGPESAIKLIMSVGLVKDTPPPPVATDKA